MPRTPKKTVKKTEAPRFTAPRQRVFDRLVRSGTPMKAYDIIEALGDVKPMTVYRALDFLTAHGFIHRIETMNAYVPCREKHCAHEDSFYAICDTCGAAFEVHDHALNHALSAAVKKQGFTVQRANLELHGDCANCAK